MNQLSFNGEVVAVTGAAGGLGKDLVLELARRGARIVANDLGGDPRGGGSNPDLIEQVTEQIRALGGEAISSSDNIATPDGGKRIVELAMAKWGRLDGVVANAGILRNRHFDEMSVDDWDDLIAVNVRGTFCTVQPAFKVMKSNGYGRIVIVTSTAGLCGGYGMANYASSKTAVLGLTRSVAWEGLSHGVLVNALAPGSSVSRMTKTIGPDDALFAGRPEALRNVNMTSIDMPPEQVTPLTIALLHRSCSTTGEMLCAAGGWFFRMSTHYNEGWVSKIPPSPESIVEHWTEIRGKGMPHREVVHEAALWINTIAERLT
jgi:NAD(P)-dependent dehydrogenase (short-subunit alcohol dehydrogenase family)